MTVRASLIYLSANAASGALSLVSLSLFARLLGPAGYAQWALAVTLSGFLVGIFVQPLNASLARFFPRLRFEGLTACVGRAVLSVGVMTSPLALLLVAFPSSWLPPRLVIAAWLLGFAQGAFDFGGQHAVSTLQSRRYAYLYLARSVLLLVLGVTAIELGLGLGGVVAAALVSYLLSSAFMTGDAWQVVRAGRFDLSQLRAIRSYAVLIGFTVLTGYVLLWGDRLILSAYVPPTELGNYAAAGDLAVQSVGVVFNALHLAWFPRVVNVWERGGEPECRDLLRRYIQVVLSVMPAAAIGLALVGGDVASLLLGAAYQEEAARMIPWLAMAALAGGLRGYILDLPMHLTQRMGWQLSIVAVSATTNFLLNLLLIPEYGIYAAAPVALGTQFLGCLLSLAIGRQWMRLPVSWRDLAGFAIGLISMAGVVLFITLPGIPGFLLRVAAGALAYGTILLMLNVAGLRGALLSHFKLG